MKKGMWLMAFAVILLDQYSQYRQVDYDRFLLGIAFGLTLYYVIRDIVAEVYKRSKYRKYFVKIFKEPKDDYKSLIQALNDAETTWRKEQKEIEKK